MKHLRYLFILAFVFMFVGTSNAQEIEGESMFTSTTRADLLDMECGDTRIAIRHHMHTFDFGGFDGRFRNDVHLNNGLGGGIHSYLADEDNGTGASVEVAHSQPFTNDHRLEANGQLKRENRGYPVFTLLRGIETDRPILTKSGYGEEPRRSLGFDLGYDLEFTNARGELKWITPAGFWVAGNAEGTYVDYTIQKGDLLSTRFGGGLGFELGGFGLGANYEFQDDNHVFHAIPVPEAHRVTGKLDVGSSNVQLIAEGGKVFVGDDHFGNDLDDEWEFTATGRIYGNHGDMFQAQGGMVNRDPVQRRVISTFEDYSDVWFVEASAQKYLNKHFGLTGGVGYSDNDFIENEVYGNVGAVIRL